MKKIPYTLFCSLFVAFSSSAKEISIPESANWLISLDGEAFQKREWENSSWEKLTKPPT